MGRTYRTQQKYRIEGERAIVENDFTIPEIIHE